MAAQRLTTEIAMVQVGGSKAAMHRGIQMITARGDSMRGTFDDGDPVQVDTRVKYFVGDSMYLFRWNGQVQIKRLQQIGEDRLRILSSNPEYPPIDVCIDELEIGGKALAAWSFKEF